MTVPATHSATSGTEGGAIPPRVPAWPVISAVARRSMVHLARIPASLIPSVAMPLFFVVAFAGAFSGLARPGIGPGGASALPTTNILNWMVPYAALQASSFGGVAASFGLGRDLETGFYDRFLVSGAPRWAFPAGAVAYTTIRTSLPLTVTLVVGLLGGLTFPGGILALLCLVVAAVGVASAAALWGMGVTYRLKTQSAGGLVQVGLFVSMFLSVGMTPLEFQRGWLPHVARYNPITPVLGLARAGFVGSVAWSEVWPGLVALTALLFVLGLFAVRGYRKLTP